MHDMEIIFLSLLTANSICKTFQKMSDARETAICSFPDLSHDRASMIFQKRFQDDVST